ncbi:MAG: family 20 glycosylhydrolase [Promethearchaeota archaeon]
MNSLQVIIPLNPENRDIPNFSQTDDYLILPYPQHIIKNQGTARLYCDAPIHLVNIDIQHPFISQMIAEMGDDFGIQLTYSAKKLTIPLMEEYLAKIPAHREEEGYLLHISEKNLVLTAFSPHGLFNAFQTLRQILLQSHQRSQDIASKEYVFPQFKIIDWPILAMRGISDDISRGQIPTVEGLQSEILIWSQYKLNHYAMYIEDVVQTSSHPQIGKDRGAYTKEELKDIIQFAESRFVTIIPIVETVTHMDNILTHPEYMELGEFPGAQCLSIANGNIYPFLREYLGEICSIFPKTYLHIGWDEPVDLGHGNSEDLIKAVGIQQAIFDSIMKIYNIAKGSGIQNVIIYHDVILKYPELLEVLPEDIIIMYWNYSSKKKYGRILVSILEKGRKLIVSPSMLCWYRPFPEYSLAYKNMVHFIEGLKEAEKMIQNKQAISSSASNLPLGYLVSTWGDCSNHNLRANNIYGGILGANLAWGSKVPDFHTALQDVLKSFFNLSSKSINDKLTRIMEETIELEQLTQRNNLLRRNRFYDDFYRNPFRNRKKKPLNRNYPKILEKSSNLIEKLEKFQEKITLHPEYLEYLHFSLKTLQIYAEKDRMRVQVNYLLKKSGTEVVDSPNSADTESLATRETAINVIAEFIANLSAYFGKYEFLWTRYAKFPHFNRQLERYQQLHNHCSNQIDLLRENLPFTVSFLRSKYIWSKKSFSGSHPHLFKKVITISHPVKRAFIQVIAGNHSEIYCNGIFKGFAQSRFSLSILPIIKSVSVFDITDDLLIGENIIIIEAYNFLKSKGFLNVVIQIETNEGNIMEFGTNDEWSVSLTSYENFLSLQETRDLVKLTWKSATDIGRSPKFGGDIYHPKLLEGQRSIAEDYFRYKDFM